MDIKIDSKQVKSMPFKISLSEKFRIKKIENPNSFLNRADLAKLGVDIRTTTNLPIAAPLPDTLKNFEFRKKRL
jgi:hypothetical protein